MTTTIDICRRALGSSRVLGHLTDAAAEALIEAGWSMTYAAEATVHGHEKPLDGMLIVLQGRIEVTRRMGNGRRIVVDRLASGDVDGELAVLAGTARAGDATALETVEALLLYRRDILAALEASPGALRAALAVLAGDLCRAAVADEDRAIRDRAAVAAALLRLTAEHGRPLPDGILVDLALSQTGLAAHAGLDRATASRQLVALRDLGLVRAHGSPGGGAEAGKIVILDRDALQDYAGAIQA